MMPLQPLWWDEVNAAQKLVSANPGRLSYKNGKIFIEGRVFAVLYQDNVTLAKAICASYNLFITLVSAVIIMSRKLKDRREPKGKKDA